MILYCLLKLFRRLYSFFFKFIFGFGIQYCCVLFFVFKQDELIPVVLNNSCVMLMVEFWQPRYHLFWYYMKEVLLPFHRSYLGVVEWNIILDSFGYCTFQSALHLYCEFFGFYSFYYCFVPSWLVWLDPFIDWDVSHLNTVFDVLSRDKFLRDNVVSLVNIRFRLFCVSDIVSAAF